MHIYLVGGAIRDKLLNRPVKEQDWVVVGATANDMLAQGFRPVGKDFPVFLHPKSNEEYALARTERKTGKGYRGFSCDASSSVTLEEDLQRRDLTVNAMAQDEQGQLIDPFGGQKDLQAKVLRHVSPAFAEDPVRVLRVARFAARYAHLGFSVAEDTIALMQDIGAAGELDYLVAERVWQELEKALAETNPEVFFETLKTCRALEIIFPEIDALFGVPQTAKYHPEIDTGIHTLMVLQQASQLSVSTQVRFAALTHDLGKATTPKEEWPRHLGHEERSAKLVKQLCKRIKAPNHFRDLAVLVARYHLHCHRALELRPNNLLKLFNQTGAFRQPEKFAHFLLACEADARGRKGLEQQAYPQAQYLQQALAKALSVTSTTFTEQGLEGKAIGEAMNKARCALLKTFKQQYQTSHE